MKFSVVVDVNLRSGIADPEGATIERALPALGFVGVTNVRAGKSFYLDVEAANEAAAVDKAQALAERLLSNPVIEDARVRVVTGAS
jgi:phosphoribosylformylglycinamidine synthase